MKKVFTLMLTLLLLLCALVPTASFAAEEETITKEEAEALYGALRKFYETLQQSPVNMIDMQDPDANNGNPQPKETVTLKDANGKTKEYHRAKPEYEDEALRLQLAETIFVKDLAPRTVAVTAPGVKLLNGKIYIVGGATGAPNYPGLSEKWEQLDGDATHATLETMVTVAFETAIPRTVELEKTADGWRVCGGTLIGELYPSNTPQTADPIDPATVTLWVSIAVLSLAAITIALHQRKRVAE